MIGLTTNVNLKHLILFSLNQLLTTKPDAAKHERKI